MTIVADDIDPKATSAADVETITGEIAGVGR